MTKKKQRGTWRERFKSSKNKLDESGEALNPPSDHAEPFNVFETKKPRWRSFRFWLITFSILFFGPILLVLGLLVGGYYITRNIPSAKIIAFVHDKVTEKLGASLTIDSIKFDILEEIDIKGIVFHPTMDTTLRPLFKLDRFHFVYHPFRLIRGQIVLDEAMLYHPQIYLERVGERWNFTPLLEKLQAGKQPEPEPQKPETPPPKTLAEMIPVNPAVLLVPFKTTLQRIGLEQLEFEMDDSNPELESKKNIKLRGLDVIAGVNWHMRDSQIQADITSHGESPIDFSMKGKGKGQPDTNMEAHLNLAQSFSLDDLEKVRFNSDLMVKSIRNGKLQLSDLQNVLRVQITVPSSFTSIRIDGIKIALNDIVQYEQTGDIQLVDGSINNLRLNLQQNAFVDLGATQKFLELFHVPATVSGSVRLSKLNIEGPLNLEQLKQEVHYDELPSVTLLVKMDNISAQAPKFGSLLTNLDGTFSLLTRPSSEAKAVQAELDTKVQIASVKTTQNVKGKKAEVQIKDLVTTLVARASYPAPNLHFLKLNTTIASLKANDGSGLKVDLPFALDVNGSLTHDMKQSNLTARAEIGDIVDFSLDASCDNACEKVRLRQATRIDSFQKIYAIVKPVLGKFLPTEQTPTLVKGALDFKTDVKAQIKNPKEKNPEKLLGELKAGFNLQLGIVDFGVKVPMMDANLDGLTAKVTISGDEKNQKIDVDQSLKQASATVSKPGMLLTPTIDQQSLRLIVSNTIDSLVPLKDIPKNATTGIDAKIYVGKVSADQVLPAPLSAIALTVLAQQQKANRVDLLNFSFSVPDLGFDTKAKAFALLSPEYKPTSVGANASVSMRQFGSVPLPMAVKIKGQMEAEVAVNSPDMDKFIADGKLAFDHFNVSIPAKEEGKPALAEVQDIDGEIPFTQVVSLKALADLPNKLKKGPVGRPKPEQTESKTAVATGTDTATATITSTATEVAATTSTATDTDTALTSYLNRKKRHAEVQSIIPRVDYGKTRDFFPGKRVLRIARVSAANLSMRNLEFDMELKKERFAINNFVIDFLDGKIQGNVQVPMDLLPQSLHLEVHMTKLNTQRLLDNFPNLKSKTESFLLTSDPVIEGVILFDFDIVQNDIGGAIDITTIGKEQLKMMLYYLDPEEKDNTLSAIRKALIVGNVQSVSIPIKNGYMGMEIGLTALGIPIPLPKVARIPIAQIVKNVMNENQTANNDRGDGTDEL